MPRYVAFLRAINLGATRKFPAADVRAATEAAGGTDVQTHLNTGNVLLTSRRRSAAAVAGDLEKAYRADRGFEVPVVAFAWDELVQVAADVEELDHAGKHYVELLHDEPSAELQATLIEGASGARLEFRGRAMHLLADDSYLEAAPKASLMKQLGVTTNRNSTVIRAIVEKWA